MIPCFVPGERVMRPRMIHPYSNATQTAWDKGSYKVQLTVPSNSRPMGFCDGSAEDIAELKAIAESENGTMSIDVKVLKTGREIWTLRSDTGSSSEDVE